MKLYFVNHDSEVFDATEATSSVKWSGKNESASRSVTVTMLNDRTRNANFKLSPEEGWHCILYDEKEIFQGIITKISESRGNSMTVTAYDLGIYLSNNKDTFVYEGYTLSEIFIDVCSRYGVPYDSVCSSSACIESIVKKNSTAYDVLTTAMEEEYKATGIKHSVVASKGKLSLIERKEHLVEWMIESGRNISAYTYTRSIEKIKTRVKLYSKDNVAVAEEANTALETKIGVFQDSQSTNDDASEGEIYELAKSLLDEQGKPSVSLSVTADGNSELISGRCVYCILKPLDIAASYYIDSDTHTFSGGRHQMSLTLTLVQGNVLSADSNSGSTVDAQIGDIVWFNGGRHYYTANSDEPTGPLLTAGPAKVQNICAGAKHPYALVHTDNQSMVYGWVDIGTFGKKG